MIKKQDPADDVDDVDDVDDAKLLNIKPVNLCFSVRVL